MPKSPAYNQAAWTPHVVYRGHSRNRPKGGCDSPHCSTSTHCSDHLSQFTLNKSPETSSKSYICYSLYKLCLYHRVWLVWRPKRIHTIIFVQFKGWSRGHRRLARMDPGRTKNSQGLLITITNHDIFLCQINFDHEPQRSYATIDPLKTWYKVCMPEMSHCICNCAAMASYLTIGEALFTFTNKLSPSLPCTLNPSILNNDQFCNISSWLFYSVSPWQEAARLPFECSL